LDPSAQLSRCHPGRRDQRGQLVRAPGARRGGDHLAARHGQHVPDLLLFRPSAQLGVAAVHLIPGHPRERDSRRDRAPDHLPGLLWLGRERHVIVDPGETAPVRVPGPPLRKAQFPVDWRPRPVRRDEGQEHPTCAFSTRPGVPVYCRATPADIRPFKNPVSSTAYDVRRRLLTEAEARAGQNLGLTRVSRFANNWRMEASNFLVKSVSLSVVVILVFAGFFIGPIIFLPWLAYIRIVTTVGSTFGTPEFEPVAPAPARSQGW
jgi:hypothetical protein